MTPGSGFLTLPYPPSTNGLFANVPGRGRVRTQRYQTWIRAAQNQAMAQKRWRIEGTYVLDLTIQRRNVRADLDNCIKALSDFLVDCEYVPDDRHMAEIRARWGDVDGCEVRAWAVTAADVVRAA